MCRVTVIVTRDILMARQATATQTSPKMFPQTRSSGSCHTNTFSLQNGALRLLLLHRIIFSDSHVMRVALPSPAATLAK